MKKKLRLLLTTKCENRCALCCNNQFLKRLKRLKAIDLYTAVQLYEEIEITGGNPLYSDIIKNTKLYIYMMREFEKRQNKNIRIYLYTNTCDVEILMSVLKWPIDGITITPHSSDEIDRFIKFNDYLKTIRYQSNLSIRVTLMDKAKLIQRNSLWEGFKVKELNWLKDCPVPSDEDFCKIPWLL